PVTRRADTPSPRPLHSLAAFAGAPAFCFTAAATPALSTLSLHDALPISFLAETSGIGRGILTGQAVEQLVGRLIRQDDHFEVLPELPGTHHRVDDRHVGHLPGIEHPPRPPLVDRRRIRAVQTDPWRLRAGEAGIPGTRGRG